MFARKTCDGRNQSGTDKALEDQAAEAGQDARDIFCRLARDLCHRLTAQLGLRFEQVKVESTGEIVSVNTNPRIVPSVGASYSLGRDASSAGGAAATGCPGELAADDDACRQITALLGYDTRPDVRSSELLQLIRYGRTA